MSAELVAVDEPQSSASSVLRTLALCDLVDSTGLIERMGDLAAAELIRKHDRLARTLANRHHGREIDKTDGFMMMFDRPIQAVAFALEYQRGLKQLNAAEDTNLSARVGIHVGDIVIWDNSAEDIAKGAKPVEVEGLVKPVSSRLMNLAMPGQILLSNIAYSLAHRAQGELGEYLETARWRTHGRYLFRGVADPVPVFEVGEEGQAPLKPPPWSSKAHREVPFWRRPATMVIEAMVIAALIVIPLVMFLRPDPAIAFAERNWVVVGSLHNLTGETLFDDALESALRIGLEQSRYVNVIPDLKVRDTITRMQLDPNDTEVDRYVGSEIAIRDGARALILPTIAEIGGRVRITAEVIDPHTQTTVYSETADGIGKESILPSLDTINERLRVRLGEALATVTNGSMPLEKVATKNLAALRVYSLALKSDGSGDVHQAITLYKQAIDLDTDFARARLGLAALNIEMGDRITGEQQLLTALANKERLSVQDRLMGEAWLATLGSHAQALAKWKALSSFAPDMFYAQGGYAFFSWSYANDYRSAIDAVRNNITAQNPNPGTGHYLLATLYLGMERYSDSLAQFEEARSNETRFQNDLYSAAYASQRQFARIAEIKKNARPASTDEEKDESRIYELAFNVDQGQWKAVGTESNVQAGLDSNKDSLQRSLLRDAELGVQLIALPQAKRKQKLQRVTRSMATGHSGNSNLNAVDQSKRLLFHAFLASLYGQNEDATALMAKIPDEISAQSYPVVAKLKVLVESQMAINNGDAGTAIAQIDKLIDGTEPYSSHLVLMNAFAATDDFMNARNQAIWLASHRGRAYTEVFAGTMFIPFNIAQSNLAWLYRAEYSSALGQSAEARASVNALRAAWPTATTPKWVADRMQKLEVR